jgi:hypothetical protein
MQSSHDPDTLTTPPETPCPVPPEGLDHESTKCHEGRKARRPRSSGRATLRDFVLRVLRPPSRLRDPNTLTTPPETPCPAPPAAARPARPGWIPVDP